MPQRHPYDLSHQILQVGEIGRLQCLSRINVLAGDSIGYEFDGVLRLSPLRRPLTFDVKVDFYGFFVPHRHIYGDDWTGMIKDGVDESYTLAKHDCPILDVPSLLWWRQAAETSTTAMPLHIPEGLMRIWNRYFRDPHFSERTRASHLSSGSFSNAFFGPTCAHLKSLPTTGRVRKHVSDADKQVTLTNSKLDVEELSKMIARYKSESRRELFAMRYNDVMKHFWDTRVNVDADERPTFLFSDSAWLSGRDVDGTDDARLGSAVGKAVSGFSTGFPRKFFSEHGTLWVFVLLRFPPIHQRERHYLDQPMVYPSYADSVSEYDYVKNLAPVTLNTADIFADGNTGISLGVYPHGQWHRTHPNYVHQYFDQYLGSNARDVGYPVLPTPKLHSAAIYIDPSAYDQVFQSSQLAHYQLQGVNRVYAVRPVPPVTDSYLLGDL